jgi:tetratricopeptide (TPR) repeat protein
VVIDNAESLLTESGQWRDDSWGRVIGALTRHKGLGRLILTSRRVPAGLTGLKVEAVDALSPDEALLLARELPNLRRLICGELPGIDRDDSRRLALGVLNIAQGHPKLLELADGQAAHPDGLAALVAAGDQAWREQGGLPDGFFMVRDASTEGASAERRGDYWRVLAAWTHAVADTLTPGERDLFWFLCCLEEPDRERWILEANWAYLWQHLHRDGEPPDLEDTLAAVTSFGLAAVRPETYAPATSYTLHPGVAEAGRGRAETPFLDTTDAEIADFWAAIFQEVTGTAEGAALHTGLMVRSGLASVPYLLRQQRWADATVLLERAFLCDPSRSNAAAMLPMIQQITRHDPSAADVLGLVLQVLDPGAGEAVLRSYLAAAVEAGDYQAASTTAGRLARLCLDSGRLANALDLADQTLAYARQANLGPWTQLLDEVQRLEVLNFMGQADHVLAEVTRLHSYLDSLPSTPGPGDLASSWDVREVLLGVGGDAALKLGRYQEALDFNKDRVASLHDRDAPVTEIASARFKEYGPLLHLGRTNQALELLLGCLHIFQESHNTRMIGNTLTALASAEDRRGHGSAAVRLQRDALRHHYRADDLPSIAASYSNLGEYLHRHARQPAEALASHLAADLICVLTGGMWTSRLIHGAATDLRELGTAAVLPVSVADLARQLGDIPGTDLPGLIRQVCPDAETAERTLRDVITQAQELAATATSDEQ